MQSYANGGDAAAAIPAGSGRSAGTSGGPPEVGSSRSRGAAATAGIGEEGGGYSYESGSGGGGGGRGGGVGGGGGNFEVGTYDDNLGSNLAGKASSDEEEDMSKPKVLLMGLRRSGKSSIQKVVFHKMSPNETLFLESTNKINKEDVIISSFVRFAVWDTPGQLDYFDPNFDLEAIFGGFGALIFVIDAQDDYLEAISKLVTTVLKAHSVNPDMHFEVFIHKVDSLSDDTKGETQRDVNSRAVEEMMAESGQGFALPMAFHLTSIYDHSIFEAFSKVVQKLIPQLPALEHLMNSFIQISNSEKAFLFDVVSKIYIATDSSPVDMQTYELCCDMIDVVIDVSCIYGYKY